MPFAVICDDDGTLFGAGDTEAAAWKDAKDWIEDAYRDQFRAEFDATIRNGGTLEVPLTFSAHACTDRLRADLAGRGGHAEWVRREGGILDLKDPEPSKAPQADIGTRCDWCGTNAPRPPRTTWYRTSWGTWCSAACADAEEGCK